VEKEIDLTSIQIPPIELTPTIKLDQLNNSKQMISLNIVNNIVDHIQLIHSILLLIKVLQEQVLQLINVWHVAIVSNIPLN